MESSVGLYPAIARLPGRQFDVMVLHYVLDCSTAKTAGIMGITEARCPRLPRRRPRRGRGKGIPPKAGGRLHRRGTPRLCMGRLPPACSPPAPLRRAVGADVSPRTGSPPVAGPVRLDHPRPARCTAHHRSRHHTPDRPRRRHDLRLPAVPG
ncbi:sigma factor-like helix-turn-helix DNA-binding protein [Streptomyces natalensis]|uniref:sigma factor-like helix-turn-helix DNA-binding protein n=1 Tax=Streptomyces natalensis TaxID=68242 RepID=UPI003B82F52D